MGLSCVICPLPAVLCTLADVDNSIERWWQAAGRNQEASAGVCGKVINALAMAASYDADPTQFLGIQLPVIRHSQGRRGVTAAVILTQVAD